MRPGIEGLERRKVGGDGRDNDLEELLSMLEVLQPMCSQVAQQDAIRQVVYNDAMGRIGEQHLPAMADCTNARCAMNVQTEIVIATPLRLAGVQADAGRQAGALRPRVIRESALDLRCGDDGVDGARKGDEEAIA